MPLHVCMFGKVLSKFAFPEQPYEYSTQVEEVADIEVINSVSFFVFKDECNW